MPTPQLTPDGFEAFVHALLMALRLLGSHVRHVRDVVRWGVSGDKQDGNDLFGHWNDGTPSTWQCKQLKRLRPFELDTIVSEVSFEGAADHHLVYSRVASAAARNAIHRHGGWQLLDRRDITEMFRLLPSWAQRDLLERFWGREVRRLFLDVPEDAFVSLERFATGPRNPAAILNDLGPLSGRETELEALDRALSDEAEAGKRIVLVVGPGGRGKTRVVTEALERHARSAPGTPVVCLTLSRTVSAEALADLRPGRAVIFVHDAHNDPEALAPLLALVRQDPEVRMILATRPSARALVEEAVSLAGFWPDECGDGSGGGTVFAVCSWLGTRSH